MSGDIEPIEIEAVATDDLDLLDLWIMHATQLEAENERLRRKYAAAHERCEQLREIVAEDYPPVPF